MDQSGVDASPARGHLKTYCPCCSIIPYACVQVNFTIVQDHSLLLHFVLLTDAVAVHVLYCRFLLSSRPLEHPGGIIGCKDKRAPMVLI